MHRIIRDNTMRVELNFTSDQIIQNLVSVFMDDLVKTAFTHFFILIFNFFVEIYFDCHKRISVYCFFFSFLLVIIQLLMMYY